MDDPWILLVVALSVVLIVTIAGLIFIMRRRCREYLQCLHLSKPHATESAVYRNNCPFNFALNNYAANTEPGIAQWPRTDGHSVLQEGSINTKHSKPTTNDTAFKLTGLFRRSKTEYASSRVHKQTNQKQADADSCIPNGLTISGLVDRNDGSVVQVSMQNLHNSINHCADHASHVHPNKRSRAGKQQKRFIMDGVDRIKNLFSRSDTDLQHVSNQNIGSDTRDISDSELSDFDRLYTDDYLNSLECAEEVSQLSLSQCSSLPTTGTCNTTETIVITACQCSNHSAVDTDRLY